MRRGTASLLAGLLVLLVAGGLAGLALSMSDPPPGQQTDRGGSPRSSSDGTTRTQTPSPRVEQPTELPFGGRRIDRGRILVAYYGTPGTGSLGVLGERPVPEMTRQLRRAAQPYARPGRPAQIVYELIVTVADRVPGPDGDYSHDISPDKVRTFIGAAHRNRALVVLDVQPGRSSFLDVVRRWRWALEDPWVSLALDPEWRVGPHQVPGRKLGHVEAEEINVVGFWLNGLIRSENLPDKLLVIHQFRTDMVRDIRDVVDRPLLSEVQHVDGFGSRAQKLATYSHIERDRRFRMGLKLFYDEDRNLLTPARVLGIRPTVRYVSYQ